jgi:Na+:H+ antiporter, NhaA family
MDRRQPIAAMVFFFGGLAFPGTPFESQAKLAMLPGSLLAATVGIVILLTTRQPEPDPH